MHASMLSLYSCCYSTWRQMLTPIPLSQNHHENTTFSRWALNYQLSSVLKVFEFNPWGTFCSQNPKSISTAYGSTSKEADLAVKILKLLLRLIYYAVCILAGGIFALNFVHPTSPEFLSSVLLQVKACGTLCTPIVVVSSGAFQAYLLMAFSIQSDCYHFRRPCFLFHTVYGWITAQ